MKKIIMTVAVLILAVAGAANAEPQARTKLYLSPNSMVPRAEIMKHLVDKCPNVAFTLDPKKSDYMLEAWGWSGNYKFTVFQKGGLAVYSTTTVMLSNSVKDVCKFVNSQPRAEVKQSRDDKQSHEDQKPPRDDPQ
ncbi:MAG: hypothetical protein ACRD5M_02880 [Candidatus Acidiferrales bacterium]